MPALAHFLWPLAGLGQPIRAARSTRTLLATSLLGAAAALGLVSNSACSTTGNIEWASARRGELVVGVEVEGTLRAVDSTPVKPPSIADKWNFKLASLAPEGTVVKVGDPIAGFDPSDLMEQIQQLNNDIDAAQTQIRNINATARMARQNELLMIAENDGEVTKKQLVADQPADLVASIELETADIDKKLAETKHLYAIDRAKLAARADRTKLVGQRDALAYAEAKLALVQQSVAKLRVVAKRPGTIIHPDNGQQKIKVGATVWRMQSVAEVVSLDRMRGEGKIDEVDSSKIAVDQLVRVRVDAHPDTEVMGKVAEIGRSFAPKSATDLSKAIDIKIILEDGHGLPLRPGMRFRGEVENKRVADSIIVPKDAVFVGAGGAVAYVRDGNSVKAVSVELGASSSTEIVITSGLSDGDDVALEVPVAFQRSAR